MRSDPIKSVFHLFLHETELPARLYLQGEEIQDKQSPRPAFFRQNSLRMAAPVKSVWPACVLRICKESDFWGAMSVVPEHNNSSGCRRKLPNERMSPPAIPSVAEEAR